MAVIEAGSVGAGFARSAAAAGHTVVGNDFWLELAKRVDARRPDLIGIRSSR